MSSDKQWSDDVVRMRRDAEALELRAQRADDAAEREQLMEKAVRLRAKCEELGGPESATMDPM
ncbi:DUF6381 family protein [Streptomyces virginiae]|uniref:DUF6381 family protein n=1 Tax=Streptomyces virginiae TaxID=1961 RepID=UPI0022577705|nr:DUF6381 family protein [Streptomyces virginiae]MCX4718377.1 DUF6381 family protein [Streptomyces virginiae]MCX5275143.1 DUF6381 family protein [Streptomyces virginiae]